MGYYSAAKETLINLFCILTYASISVYLAKNKPQVLKYETVVFGL